MFMSVFLMPARESPHDPGCVGIDPCADRVSLFFPSRGCFYLPMCRRSAWGFDSSFQIHNFFLCASVCVNGSVRSQTSALALSHWDGIRKCIYMYTDA